MRDILVKLGWGSSMALLVGAAFLLSKYAGYQAGIAAFSAGFAYLQKLRESGGWADAGLTAAPGVALGAGAYFVG